jgi:hypothetical protein
MGKNKILQHSNTAVFRLREGYVSAFICLTNLLSAYRVYWQRGHFILKEHADFKWVTVTQLHEFDFALADLPFVKKLISAEMEI